MIKEFFDSGLQKELAKPIREEMDYEITIANTRSPKNKGEITFFPEFPIDEISNTDYIFFPTNPSDEYAYFGNKTIKAQTEKKLGDKKSTEGAGIYSKKYYKNSDYDSPFFGFNVTLSETEDLGGITFVFGSDKNVFPTEISVTVYEHTEQPNSTSYIVYGYPESNIFSMPGIPTNATLEIRIHKMNRTGVRFHLSSIMAGTQTALPNKNIISFNVSRKSHPMSKEFPQNTLSIEYFDEEDKFRKENEQSLYKDILGSKIYLDFVRKDIKIRIGTYSVFDVPNFNGKNVTITAESSALGLISRMENHIDFHLPVEGQENYGSFYLFMRNLEKYLEQNENLETETSYFNILYTNYPSIGGEGNFSYVKDDKAPEELLKIANSYFGIIKETTTPTLIVKPTSTVSPEEIINLNGENGVPISGEIKIDTNSPEIQDISVITYDQTTGKKAVKYFRGEFVVDNNYITSLEMARDVLKDEFRKWVKGTRKYIIPCLASPAIEVGDYVRFKGPYGEKVEGIVSENNYSYPTNAGSDNLVVYSMFIH